MNRTVRPNSSVWLERQPVTLEVTSSSLVWVAINYLLFERNFWGQTCLDSSVGRARDWKSLCRRFDSTLRHHTDRFQSGQMDQTVNLTSQTSVVRIHLCPPKKDTRKVSFFGCAGGKKNAVFTAVCSRNENRKPFNSITFPNVFSKAKFYPYFLLAFLFKTCYNQ